MTDGGKFAQQNQQPTDANQQGHGKCAAAAQPLRQQVYPKKHKHTLVWFDQPHQGDDSDSDQKQAKHIPFETVKAQQPERHGVQHAPAGIFRQLNRGSVFFFGRWF